MNRIIPTNQVPVLVPVFVLGFVAAFAVACGGGVTSAGQAEPSVSGTWTDGQSLQLELQQDGERVTGAYVLAYRANRSSRQDSGAVIGTYNYPEITLDLPVRIGRSIFEGIWGCDIFGTVNRSGSRVEGEMICLVSRVPSPAPIVLEKR